MDFLLKISDAIWVSVEETIKAKVEAIKKEMDNLKGKPWEFCPANHYCECCPETPLGNSQLLLEKLEKDLELLQQERDRIPETVEGLFLAKVRKDYPNLAKISDSEILDMGDSHPNDEDDLLEVYSDPEEDAFLESWERKLTVK
jgi:hypothetical protein